MALITKTSPVGIDFVINIIQGGLFTELSKVWTDYESFPRSYINPREGNTVPEHYVGENEYKEVFLDDDFNVSSFFLTDNSRARITETQNFQQRISVIFQADLPKLYPNIPHRADEEMHVDIKNALAEIDQENKILDFVTSVDDVYREFNISGELKEFIKMDDMSNLHVVKVDIDTFYTVCGDLTELL